MGLYPTVFRLELRDYAGKILTQARAFWPYSKSYPYLRIIVLDSLSAFASFIGRFGHEELARRRQPALGSI